jgi:hypothetical protein
MKYKVTKGQTHTFFQNGKKVTYPELHEFEADPKDVKYALKVGTVAPATAAPTNDLKQTPEAK